MLLLVHVQSEGKEGRKEEEKGMEWNGRQRGEKSFSKNGARPD
jgi:hypothetical protein